MELLFRDAEISPSRDRALLGILPFQRRPVSTMAATHLTEIVSEKIVKKIQTPTPGSTVRGATILIILIAVNNYIVPMVMIILRLET